MVDVPQCRFSYQSSLLAQLVERETVNLEAVGSIPTQRDSFCF